MMDSSPSVRAMLEALRGLGVRLHLDDFGTGYSSLSYLQRMSAHALKIDRSFVANLTEGVESAELVRTIIAMAKNLGMEVIAEGVETAAQARQLKALGCGYAQGYLFSEPLDAETAMRLLQRAQEEKLSS